MNPAAADTIVLTPTLDGNVHHSHVTAIAAFNEYLRATHRATLLTSVMEGCSLLGHARNALLSEALKRQDIARWILWLDADTVLGTADLIDLHAAAEQALQYAVRGDDANASTGAVIVGSDMLSRPVPDRPTSLTSDLLYADEPTSGVRAYAHTDLCYHARSVGLGCTMMSMDAALLLAHNSTLYALKGELYRDVFRAGVHYLPEEIAAYEGEDAHACRTLREKGGRVFMSLVQPGHAGRSVATVAGI